MSTISPTLRCKNIIRFRRQNSLPVYNNGLGANPLPQPEFLIKKVKESANKKDYTPVEG